MQLLYNLYGFVKKPLSMNSKNPKDIDGAEISWFAPICDGDDDFLGNRNPDYKSTWENTSNIVIRASFPGSLIPGN